MGTTDKSEPTRAELDGMPTALLTGHPATDVLGESLDWSDPAKAQQQQRAAVTERSARVAEDVKRVERGLKPKYATK